jgi:biopolymer transport protein ExbB/TolQ
VKFKCPSCGMSLKAEPEMAGKVVRCPGCNTKLQIPESAAASSPTSAVPPPAASSFGGLPPPDAAASMPAPGSTTSYLDERPERMGWKEADPTNPNGWVAFGIGLVVTFMIFGIFRPFIAPASVAVSDFNTMQWLANILYKHFTISFLNVTFFCWAMAIVYLKIQKLRHQREALLLDVLPMELGREINSTNVGTFIDHVYNLPHRLRDSLMVNRIRKALELFEVKTSSGDVAHQMDSQSAIDGARIGSSYIMLKAFLWAIPLLGFIGTVIGLSHAIGGMNFANVEDVGKIVDSINAVTSGLGTAFDATLLGLVLAVLLNFPMNSLSKSEEEMLNGIDAFCNEVLLPRLNDGAGAGAGDTAAIADSVIKGLSSAQKEFLTDLNELSKRMNDYATNLDKRSDAFQATVTKEFVTNMTTMRGEVEGALRDSMKMTSQYISALETGIRGLNTVLKELGGQQIVVQQVKRKGWFSRG